MVNIYRIELYTIYNTYFSWLLREIIENISVSYFDKNQKLPFSDQNEHKNKPFNTSHEDKKVLSSFYS